MVLGGRTATSLIELHDVRFVVGSRIEDTFPELRRQWFGRRDGLHLDAYMAVRAVDGWQVHLSQQPAPARAERLWFVNLGAYTPSSLAEQHHFGLPPSAAGCATAFSSTRMISAPWTTAWPSISSSCGMGSAGMCSWSAIPRDTAKRRCRIGSATAGSIAPECCGASCRHGC